MIRLVACFASLLMLSTFSIAQSGNYELSPSTGQKGQTVNLTITAKNNAPIPPSGVELFLAQESSSQVPIDNYQTTSDSTATGTISLSQSTDTGSYDLKAISAIGSQTLEINAFRVVRPFENLSLSPSLGQKGKTIDLTITGNNGVPSENFDLALGKGSGAQVPVSNYQTTGANTATGTISLSQSTDTGIYDLVVKQGNDEVARDNNAFEVLAPFQNLTVIPGIGQLGKTIDLTIEGDNSVPPQKFNLTLVKGSDFEVFVNNYQTTAANTAKGTITLNESLDTGSYDLVAKFDGNEVLRKEEAFKAVNEIGLTGIMPDKGGRDETLEVEITGKNTIFEADSQTNIIFTKGATTNANTAFLKDIKVINQSLIEGTLELAKSFDTGAYDVIYEKRDQEIIKEEGLFTVQKNPVGLNDENQGNSAMAKVYPNPLKETFNLKLTLPEAMHLSASIINPSGKEIKQVFDQRIPAGTQEFRSLSLSQGLSPGIYYLKLSSRDTAYQRTIRLNKQ